MSEAHSPWKLGTYWYDKESVSLMQLKEAGIAYIELNLDNYIPPEEGLTPAMRTRYRQAVDAAGKAGIEIWSVHLPFGNPWDISTPDDAERLAIIEAHTRVMDWARDWGAQVTVIHPSFEPIPDAQRERRLKLASASVSELSERARLRGLKLAVEDLPRSCLGRNSAEIAALIGDAPDAVVCCDTNHLLTEKPEAFIRFLGNRIGTLHLSDYDGVDERHWLPGRGIVNWAEVLQALIDSGYGGPFMFEADYKDPHELVQCYQSLMKLVSDARTP
ncbi:endonuclease [Paenibacillus dendritiformis]|uniref:sugar phosphate isomerase/epimerase family protein n=1 Tax=Paenibacillus dendritiformis TaxID=130049 RepID=UPI001B0A53B3|nr:sugar phosphate isomerase/epimerase family protein [Paenibacillus dendritiformis]GIO74675.1 endonuclease [Paenibacillus dendritiformis]